MLSLTIAIPSYNKEKYIERCIKSVLKNKDRITKIILVDNCSTDNTFEIAKKFEPEITCIKNDTNVGMSGNFNKCIEHCDTEWLMIVHADDELLDGAIEKYEKIIEKYPSIHLIHADSYSITNSDESTKSLHQVPKKEFWTAGADALSCNYGVCSAVMVRKIAYDNLGGFIVSSLSSDVEMWARISGKYDVGYINEPTVIYHVNLNSLGPQSLITRSVAEIKKDWDMLHDQIAKSYPEGQVRSDYIKRIHDEAPYSYWAVVKENIRARNYKNIFDALKVIVFDFNGLIPLLKIIFSYIKKVTIKKA